MVLSARPGQHGQRTTSIGRGLYVGRLTAGSMAAHKEIPPYYAQNNDSSTRQLGLIRLQHIYNFLLLHAIILPLLDVYGLYFTHLHHFWD